MAVLLKLGPTRTGNFIPVSRAMWASNRLSHGGLAFPRARGINETDVLSEFCQGGGPACPDGGQPTGAAVLKLSVAHLSKASNGHNNSYLQSALAFTAWDPTGLYKRNKLIHTLTRRASRQPLRGSHLRGERQQLSICMEPQDTMARPGREEWRALRGPTQPQADTRSLCYSDLTAAFDPAARATCYPGITALLAELPPILLHPGASNPC